MRGFRQKAKGRMNVWPWFAVCIARPGDQGWAVGTRPPPAAANQRPACTRQPDPAAPDTTAAQTPPHSSQAYYLQKPDVCKIFLQLITQLTAQMTEEGKLSSGGETLDSQTAFLTGSLVHDTSIVSYTFHLCGPPIGAVHKLHDRFLLLFQQWLPRLLPHAFSKLKKHGLKWFEMHFLKCCHLTVV